jgi:hypothetical protein
MGLRTCVALSFVALGISGCGADTETTKKPTTPLQRQPHVGAGGVASAAATLVSFVDAETGEWLFAVSASS